MSDRDPFERIRQRREEEEQRLRRNRRRSMMMVLGLGVLLFVIRLAFPSGSAEEDGGASSSLASSAVSSAPAAGTGTISQDGWNLILVNNENLLPQDFQVPLTTLVGSYRVDARTVDSAKAMIAAAAAEGIELQVCSAYRSVAQQERLYAAEDPVPEGQPVAVQAPGASEHHTGLALDLVSSEYTSLDEGFENTEAFAWLQEHAWEYGYILRYPRDKESITGVIYEPWHYRFVGQAHAKAIRDLGVCLEEYLQGQ